MAPESEANISPEPDQTHAVSAPRRGHRSGRGRRGGRGRGRGRGGRSRLSEQSQEVSQAESAGGSASQTPVAVEAKPDQSVSSEPQRQPERSQPALASSIEEVNRIIQTLRESLEDMEEVLESLELVERQQNADEQELETLRRQLRMLRRPRDSGA